MIKSIAVRMKTIGVLILLFSLTASGQNLVQRSINPSNVLDPAQGVTLTINLAYDKSSLTDINIGSSSVITDAIPAGLVALGVVPENGNDDNGNLALDVSIASAQGQISFNFEDDENSSVINFSYDIVIPVGASGNFEFPNNLTDVGIVYLDSGFSIITKSELIGGASLLVQGPKGITQTLVEPSNSELDTAQSSLSRTVSHGTNTGNFIASFNELGQPPAVINDLAFRVVAAAAGGPTWTPPTTIDSTNSPTFDGGNDGWLSININSPVNPTTNNDGTFTHTFPISVDTATSQTVTPTISWDVPDGYIPISESDGIVHIFQIRARDTSDTSLSQITSWAFNVFPNQVPTTPTGTIVGGDDTNTDIEMLTVSTSDADDPDDPITFNYSWQVDSTEVDSGSVAGTQNGSGVGSTWEAVIPGIISTNFDKNDQVQLVLDASNSFQSSANNGVPPIVVGNIAPTLSGTPSIDSSPTPPVYNSTLTANTSGVTIADPDTGDTSFNDKFQWLRNSAVLSGATSNTLSPADFGASKFTKGDTFQLSYAVEETISPADDSNSVTSAEITIGNGAPTINGVVREGTSEIVTSILLLTVDANPGVVNFTVDAVDPDDSDSIATVTVSDGTLGTVTSTGTDPGRQFTYTVNDNTTPFTNPDTLTITVTDDDNPSGANTLSANSQISINFIADRPPEITLMNPENAAVSMNEDQMQEFIIQANDPENQTGTPQTVTSIEWIVDDGARPGETEDPVPGPTENAMFTLGPDFTIVEHVHSLAGEIVSVTRDPVDVKVKVEVKDAVGTPDEFEWTVTVSDVNRAPSFDGVTISAAKPVETPTGAEFTVNLSGPASDPDVAGEPDADYLQYTYTWTKSGETAVEQETHKNAQGTDPLTDTFIAPNKTDAYTCEVKVTDGIDQAPTTLTITLSLSPPWYPTLTYDPIPTNGAARGINGNFEYYQVVVYNDGVTERIFDTIKQGTSIQAIDYWLDDFAGFEPGSYRWFYRFADPTKSDDDPDAFGDFLPEEPTAGASGNFIEVDYEAADTPTFPTTPDISDGSTVGRKNLMFTIGNAQGYEIERTNGATGDVKTFEALVQPEGENRSFPLSKEVMTQIQLPSNGMEFDLKVRAFNPRDRQEGLQPFTDFPSSPVTRLAGDGSVLGTVPDGLTPKDGDFKYVTEMSENFSLRWNAIPGIDYRLWLSTDTLGVLIDREPVGQVFELMGVVESSSTSVTLSFPSLNKSFTLPGVTFDDFCPIKFKWSVLPVDESQLDSLGRPQSGDWAQSQSFHILKNLTCPSIQGISSPSADTLEIQLITDSPFPDELILQRSRPDDLETTDVDERDFARVDNVISLNASHVGASENIIVIRMPDDVSFDFMSRDTVKVGIRLGNEENFDFFSKTLE